MSETKSKATKKQPKTDSKPKRTRAAKTETEPLVVFAIRLTEPERKAIHAAAGPRNATQFVRAVALAAARDDSNAFQEAIKQARELR